MAEDANRAPANSHTTNGQYRMTVTRDIQLPDDNVKNGDTYIAFTIQRRKGDDSYDPGTSTVKVRVIHDETP